LQSKTCIHDEIRSDQHLVLGSLLGLLDDLLDPNFDLLLLFLLGVRLRARALALRCLLLALHTPRVPLVHESLAVRGKLRGRRARLRLVLLVEAAAVLAQRLLDLPLLVLADQRARARPPDELLEAVEDVLLDLVASEVPDRVPVLELPGDQTPSTTEEWTALLTVCRHALAEVAI
jgi:hypothetical protein